VPPGYYVLHQQQRQQGPPQPLRPLPPAPPGGGGGRPAIVVHNHDVLCGRGVSIAGHPGNLRFRALVQSRHDANYCDSYTTSEKRAVAAEIVDHIRSLDPPGRFLQRSVRIRHPRGLEGPWEELTHSNIIKKTCQALRDCNRQDRAGYASAVAVPDDVRQSLQQRSQTGLTNKQIAERAVAMNKRPDDEDVGITGTLDPAKRPRIEMPAEVVAATPHPSSAATEWHAAAVKSGDQQIPGVTPMANIATPATAAMTGDTHTREGEGILAFGSSSFGAPSADASSMFPIAASNLPPSPEASAYQFTPNIGESGPDDNGAGGFSPSSSGGGDQDLDCKPSAARSPPSAHQQHLPPHDPVPDPLQQMAAEAAAALHNPPHQFHHDFGVVGGSMGSLGDEDDNHQDDDDPAYPAPDSPNNPFQSSDDAEDTAEDHNHQASDENDEDE